MAVDTKKVMSGLLKVMQSVSTSVINAAASRQSAAPNQIKPGNCGKCPSGKPMVARK